ncbi:D-galacturonic acid reductase [Hyphodiscus hymeniophilus]|uniref:D-galacturonic acid reductase n=1 Tax=Hyphodiscus hymeniophilus TaxID=353542 RepID=A0A9P6VFV9_9HELO|nr:D-galacturonic acid reductase [Hyphodiscus hymeniophilus]
MYGNIICFDPCNMAPSSFKLNTGASIPALGLGTWQSGPGEVKNAVSYALRTGYKLIDCAFCYGNEYEVGEGIKEALNLGAVKREDFFVTSKMWCTFSSRVEENLDMSLKALGLDYIDLYLIHWPVAMNPHGNDIRFPTLPDGSRDLDMSWSHIETWKQMEKLVGTGKVKAIGVCNYSVRYLEGLLPQATIIPAVNQIENHPYLPQDEIVSLCHAKNIRIMAYSPLGSAGSPLMKEPTVESVAAKYRVSPATVVFSYHNKRGITVIAKSVKESRIDQNSKIIDLDQRDMKALENIHKAAGIKRYVYPAFNVDFGFPDKS